MQQAAYSAVKSNRMRYVKLIPYCNQKQSGRFEPPASKQVKPRSRNETTTRVVLFIIEFRPRILCVLLSWSTELFSLSTDQTAG